MTEVGSGFCRRAILDGSNALHAYELVDRSGIDRGDASRLAQTLALAEVGALAGRRPLLVPCTPEALPQLLQALPGAGQFVLRVTPGPEPALEAAARAAPALQALRLCGARFAWPLQLLDSPWPELAPPDYVTVDVGALAPETAVAALKLARRQSAAVIATRVDTAALHATATSGGAQLFQGDWFSQPMLPKGQVMRTNQALILQLVALLRQQAELRDVEELLKRDAALSFNLLRFVNSAGMGHHPPVTTFRAAVLLVGMERLLRWATILLATSQPGMRALGHTAVVRGRLMELLAGNLLPSSQWDEAFVVGVFSLLDAMTGIPLPLALEGLGLTEDVVDALLRRTGPLAPLLGLAEACEAANEDAFAQHARLLRLTGHQINLAHLHALAWAEDVLAA